jgi:transporter family-2 protein
MPELLLIVFAMLAGAILPIQAGVNARLARAFDHPLQASLVSFLVGTALLVLFCVLGRWPWPAIPALAALPKWSWIGGALGVVFVTGAIILAPRLGATTLVGCVIAGQLCAGMIIDHWGLLGMPQHSFSLGRLVGIGLLAAGVFLLRRF